MDREKQFRFVLSVLMFICIGLDTNAQKYNEYEVKAVYIYQFSKFINWPEPVDSTATFIIGVYGNNPFATFSNVIYEGKLFKGRKCVIRQISTKEEAFKCQMIFFSGVEKYTVLKFISKLKSAPILLIGDQIDDFCLIGGMINFTPKESEFRFEINPETTKTANLEVSSKLFAVGRIISDTEAKF
jgi:hypothetical protein